MALSDKGAYMQVIGSLMRSPSLLGEGLASSITKDDFDNRFLQSIFISINNLYTNGATSISVVDVDNYLREYDLLAADFKKGNGIQYLQDCEDVVQEGNFEYYCERMKKFSALRALDKMGYDVSTIYNDKILDPYKDIEQKQKFDEMSINDLFSNVATRLAKVENQFVGYNSDSAGPAGEGMLELIEQLKLTPEIGYPLQGEVFNTVVRGARLTKFYLMSAATNIGKSRIMFGNASFLAYPWRYSNVTKQWEHFGGDGKKTLIITTELDLEEVKTILLANVSGLNEEKILYGTYTDEEYQIVLRAAKVMNDYSANLHIEQIPDPNVARIKSVMKKHKNMNGIEYAFFDYIFTSPSLLSEFRDIKVREDVALGLLSAALKDLANELGIFIMSATQLSGDYENVKTAKTQTLLRGERKSRPNISYPISWMGVA